MLPVLAMHLEDLQCWVTILKCTACLGWMLGPGCGSSPFSSNLPNLAPESSLSLYCSLFLIAGPAFLMKNSVAVAIVVCHFRKAILLFFLVSHRNFLAIYKAYIHSWMYHRAQTCNTGYRYELHFRPKFQLMERLAFPSIICSWEAVLSYSWLFAWEWHWRMCLHWDGRFSNEVGWICAFVFGLYKLGNL